MVDRSSDAAKATWFVHRATGPRHCRGLAPRNPSGPAVNDRAKGRTHDRKRHPPERNNRPCRTGAIHTCTNKFPPHVRTRRTAAARRRIHKRIPRAHVRTRARLSPTAAGCAAQSPPAPASGGPGPQPARRLSRALPHKCPAELAPADVGLRGRGQILPKALDARSTLTLTAWTVHSVGHERDPW